MKVKRAIAIVFADTKRACHGGALTGQLDALHRHVPLRFRVASISGVWRNSCRVPLKRVTVVGESSRRVGFSRLGLVCHQL